LGYITTMKAFMAFLLIVAVLAGFFYAYQFVISKSMKDKPVKPEADDIRPVWEVQKEKNADMMQRQRDLQRQQQERMRDRQRR